MILKTLTVKLANLHIQISLTLKRRRKPQLKPLSLSNPKYLVFVDPSRKFKHSSAIREYERLHKRIYRARKKAERRQ